MVRGKKAKTVALIVSGILLTLSVLSSLALVNAVDHAVAHGASLLQRCTYHFFHQSIIHAVTNVWCLLSITFYYNISLTDLFLAFAIASAYPVDTLCTILPRVPQLAYYNYFITPTIGFSAVCFALMGLVFFRIRRKAFFTSFVAMFIAVGLLFPGVNSVLHLYCYLAGLTVGILFMPVSHA